MNDLAQHYRDLLGLDQSWIVDDVELDLSGSQVVRVSNARGKLLCPECGQECPRVDAAPERRWRHLGTMRFATEIRTAVPRCRCDKCGGKTIQVSWAGKHSRLTLMFEAFAIRVLQAAANVKKAAELMGHGDCTMLDNGQSGAVSKDSVNGRPDCSSRENPLAAGRFDAALGFTG